jgi:hypothetical protein
MGKNISNFIGQGYSGERCGPWASCLFYLLSLLVIIINSLLLKLIDLSEVVLMHD